jgi:sensor histidine kinase YesM
VSFEIPPALLDAAVPTFVLQPFVENAIKHGILHRRSGGRIAVAAAASDGALRLSVRDDGVGLAPGWDARGTQGLGIANARTRLEHMYGAAARLQVRPADGGAGVVVEIVLPLRRHAAANASHSPDGSVAEPVLA